MWKEINQPLVWIDFDKILEVLQNFANKVYKGKLHTETILLEGFNDSTSELKQNVFSIVKLNPHKASLSIQNLSQVAKNIKFALQAKLTEVWQIYQK